MKKDDNNMNRLIHIDILRIIACMMVIFNHSHERGFYRYVVDQNGTIQWCLNLIMSIACKSAVPIFFMISGALLLGKDESIKNTYNRIIKIAFDLLFFSVLYYVVDAYIEGTKIEFNALCVNIVSGNYWHLWYLYAYIAFILTLPFFRDFVKNIKMSSAIILYIQGVILMSIIPVIENFVIGINSSLKPNWIAVNIFFYPVFGYLIDNKCDIQLLSVKRMCLAWFGDIVFFIVSIVSEYTFLQREPGNHVETFFWVFCTINAPLIFVTVKWLVSKKKEIRHSKVVSEIGKCTFGIYLLHILFLWKIQPLYRFWINYFETGMIGSIFGIYLTCICVFFLAGGLTYVLRRIPIIKWMF